MSHVDYLVTINAPPSLEEAIVDCLLTIDNAQGFSSFPVSAHDHRGKGLTLAEQVSGRQRKIRFQMYVDKKTVPALLTRLKADFSGSGLRYWVVPILEHGEI